MKYLSCVIVTLIVALSATAQIPYFAPTVGDCNLYGYTSLKFRPGINSQETYSTFQFGIGDNSATGIDLYTNGHSVYGGFLARFGYTFSKWFKLGARITPSFEISIIRRFSY